MSNSTNYIDNIPIKIAEKYKPPILPAYETPSTVANKICLPSDIFYESSLFHYDFEKERQLLQKITEWKAQRQNARDARYQRKLKREQHHRHVIEEQQKKLEAISYPSTEDFCSSSNEIESSSVTATASCEKFEQKFSLQQNQHSFNDILMPTVLSNTTTVTQPTNMANDEKLLTTKSYNTFNIKDFEEDTSSPFDTIELKTINDLDVLAEVLHKTQQHQKLGKACIPYEQILQENSSQIDDGAGGENLQDRTTQNRNRSVSLVNKSSTNITSPLSTTAIDSNHLDKSHLLHKEHLCNVNQKSQSVPNLINTLCEQVLKYEINSRNGTETNGKR